MNTLDTADFQGKRVLCRLDFDVPIDQSGLVTDDNRIVSALPTLHAILEQNPGHIIILAHRGQPKMGDRTLTLKPIADYLCTQLPGNSAERAHVYAENFVRDLPLFQLSDRVFLLENIRFLPGEESNDPALATELAQKGEVFVFEAFATAHRNHASTAGVCKLLPSVIGLMVAKELEHLTAIRDNPEHPYIVVIGGAKIEDKLPAIETMAEHADQFLIGGGVANTFLKAQGRDVKASLINEDELETARELLHTLGDKIVLPTDHVWDGEAIVDIGPSSIMQFEDHLTDARTVFWNGSLGKTEEKEWSRGTLAIADILARSPHIMRVVAGGDTVGFLDQHGLAKHMNFVSTGGGATLEYLAGQTLPA